MSPQPDVPPEVNARYLAGLRRLTPSQKAALLDAMVNDMRALLWAGIAQRNPGATLALQRWLVCEALYGAEYTARVLGPKP